MNARQKSFQKQQKPSNKSRSNFDYNKPISKCIVCHILSGWHCYDCDNDFCQDHFNHHKQNDTCVSNFKQQKNKNL